MGWHSWVEGSPLRFAVSAVFVLLLVGGTILGAFFVFGPKGCSPVGFGPTSTFGFEQTAADRVEIEHLGGDRVPADEVTIVIGDETRIWARLADVENASELLAEGDAVTVGPVSSGDRIEVRWTAEDRITDDPATCVRETGRQQLDNYTVG